MLRITKECSLHYLDSFMSLFNLISVLCLIKRTDPFQSRGNAVQYCGVLQYPFNSEAAVCFAKTLRDFLHCLTTQILKNLLKFMVAKRYRSFGWCCFFIYLRTDENSIKGYQNNSNFTSSKVGIDSDRYGKSVSVFVINFVYAFFQSWRFSKLDERKNKLFLPIKEDVYPK